MNVCEGYGRICAKPAGLGSAASPLFGSVLRNLHESHESYTLLEMGTSPFLDSVRSTDLVGAKRPGTVQRTLKAHENVLVRSSVTTVRARSRTQSV